jgi:nitrate/nitrite-specific signal transduction histidine kinase
MFKRSIITKYIVLGLIILTLIASFTILSFWFTNRIKGDARRINLAGRERMLSFQIAWLLSQAMNEKDEARIKTLWKTSSCCPGDRCPYFLWHYIICER